MPMNSLQHLTGPSTDARTDGSEMTREQQLSHVMIPQSQLSALDLLDAQLDLLDRTPGFALLNRYKLQGASKRRYGGAHQ